MPRAAQGGNQVPHDGLAGLRHFDVLLPLGGQRRHRRAAGRIGRQEAENVHRGGGRYISIIGNNDLFHNTGDRGPGVVDLNVIERFAQAFAMVATSLGA